MRPALLPFIFLGVYVLATVWNTFAKKDENRSWLQSTKRRMHQLFWTKSARLDFVYFVINRIIGSATLGATLVGSLWIYARLHGPPAIAELEQAFPGLGEAFTSRGGFGAIRPFRAAWAVIRAESFLIPHAIVLNLWWTAGHVVIKDAMRAFVHYAFHKIPALWEIHKLHHDAKVLNLFTSSRESPVEAVLTDLPEIVLDTLMFMAFISFFGAEKLNVLTVLGGNLFSPHYTLTGVLKHSHIWVSWSPKLAWFFATPASHLVHHGVEARHRDKNFGVRFAFWDLMLGTLYIPEREEHFKIGMRNANGHPHMTTGILYFYFGALADAYRKLRGRPTSYELRAHDETTAARDGLTCWCANPECSGVAYAFDNPNPAGAYTGLREIFGRSRSAGHLENMRKSA